MTKVIGLANSCKDCPNRHYYSGGAYECLKVQGSRLNDDSSIPAWCPLPDYPTALEARAGEAVAEVDESDDGLFVEILHGENGTSLKRGDKLYFHPPTGDAAGKDSVDAARYRWLREQNKRMHYTTDYTPTGTTDLIQMEVPVIGEPVFTKEGHFDFTMELDRAIDSAIASLTKTADGEKQS